MCVLSLQGAFAGVAYQARVIAHLVHDGVAGINAQGAANAFILQSIPYIDTRGANLHTQVTPNAITKSLGIVVGIAFAGTAGFAALRIVRNYQRVLIEHD